MKELPQSKGLGNWSSNGFNPNAGMGGISGHRGIRILGYQDIGILGYWDMTGESEKKGKTQGIT